MSQTTSPKKPKTPPSSPHLLPRSVQGRRAPSIPALPANPDFLPKVINDAKIVLMTILENKSDWQVSKHQVWKESHLSKTRVTKALNYLRFERFVADVVVRKSGRLHGWCFRVDLNGNVEQGGWVIHYSQDKDEFYDYGARRKEMKREKAGLSTTKRSKKRKAQSHSVSGGSERAPLHPHIEEPVYDEKKESLTLGRGQGNSDFSLPETEQQIDELTARLPEEQQHQVEQAMEEFTTNTTSPAAREDTPLSDKQEQQLLAQQHAHLLTLDPEDYIYSPPVTSEQEACSLRRAFGLWGVWKHSMHAEAALEAYAHREDRPVRFLLTALDLREYPRFHPGLAVLRLQEEPRCTDLELLGYKAVEHLKEGGRRRGDDAFNWLRHSIPGRMVLDCLAVDDPLRLHEAEQLCRWLRRGSLSVGDIARFWLLSRKAPRPVPAVNLCETIRKIVRADNEEDAVIVGCNLAWLRQRCGTDLVRLDRGYEEGAWLRALRPADLNTQGWAPADLCGAFYRVQGATQADNTESGRTTLLRVLLLQARLAGTTTADHIQQFLDTVGFDLEVYQRWLVESDSGRRAFHAALQSGHVDEAAMLAATGLDEPEHMARVRLLAAMCAAVRDGVREQGFQKATMLGYAAF